MKKLFGMMLLAALLAAMALPVRAAETTAPVTEETIPRQEPHVHSFDTLISDTATCGAAGIATYGCSCGEESQQPSQATGQHSYSEAQYADESRHKRVCSVCGQESTEGHLWDNGQVSTPATCTQDGVTVFTCQDCGGTRKQKISRLGHVYDTAASDETNHVCGTCGHAERHAWNEGEVTVKPTCSSEGTFVYYCYICEMVLAEPIEPLDTHTYDSACDPDCNVCGRTRQIQHTFTTVWSKNYKGHWHECTKCGEQKDFAKHNPGPDATEDKEQICLTCSYVITPKKEHVHNYQKHWSDDEVGHWHECSGCGDEKDYASHTFDGPCDPTCNICGYEKENNHSYTDEWQMSKFHHWQICTLCSEESERQAHVPGPEATDTTAQVCTVCGFELSPVMNHVHDFGDTWIQTEDRHWQICECGEQSVPASHKWDEGTPRRNSTVLYTCTVCGLEKSVEAPASDFAKLIVILILLGLLCIGGIVAFVIILKRGGFRRDGSDREHSHALMSWLLRDSEDPEEEAFDEPEEEWDIPGENDFKPE